MLIKIDKGRYINSDHIVWISTEIVLEEEAAYFTFEEEVNEANLGMIWLTDHHYITTTLSVIAYITQILDANEALATEAPPAMSLQSRIAIHLRDQSAGQSIDMLTAVFADTDKATLEIALNELDANNIVRGLGEDNARLYYHTTNPVFGNPSEF